MVGGGASNGDDKLLATMLASSSAGLLARFPLHPLDTIKAKVKN
jgi:hypothetical protein